jgi:hypothetical protein
MQIKPAVTEKTSDVLKNVFRSNLLQYALMAVCAVGYPVYKNLPQSVQAKVGENLLWSGIGVSFATQLLNGKIREHRLSMGDLSKEVAAYALLSAPEAKNLSLLRDAVSGKGFTETLLSPLTKTIDSLVSRNPEDEI